MSESCGRDDVCLTHVEKYTLCLVLCLDIDRFAILLNFWPHSQTAIMSEQTHHHFYDL